MMFSSFALVASLTALPVALSAGEAQGFLRQPGAAVTSDVTGTYDPCLDATELTFDLTIVEDDQDFQRCKDELPAQLKQKMEDKGCNTNGAHFRNEMDHHFEMGDYSNINRYAGHVCQYAREAQEQTPDTFAADIVATANPTFDLTEFYDGRTHLNEEIGNLTNGDGVFIDDYYQNHLTNTLVEFPDDLQAFKGCRTNAVMCCWVQDRHNENAQNNGNCRADADGVYRDGCVDKDPSDNTDMCYVDISRSKRHNHVRGGKAIFHDITDADEDNDNTEGRGHYHGFGWKDNKESPSKRYRGNILFYVSMYDHLYQRGYVRNVPGAPMCSCLDKAAVVSRSDCTEMAVTETYSIVYNSATRKLNATITLDDITFNACTGAAQNNDLESYFDRLINNGEVKLERFNETVVGEDECDSAVDTFMGEHGWVRAQ